MKRAGGRGCASGGRGGAWVSTRTAGHSTAPKGRVTISEGGGDSGGGGVDGWVRVETRRRCMKAKALQTIVTLYMTSSCYNNTAVIYCTVQVRLNIWLDKADHRRRHLQYPYTTSVLPWFCFFLFFVSFFCLFLNLFHPFPHPLSSLFLLINSTWVCIYTYLEHNMEEKKNQHNNIKKNNIQVIQVRILVRSIYTVCTNSVFLSCVCVIFFCFLNFFFCWFYLFNFFV